MHCAITFYLLVYDILLYHFIYIEQFIQVFSFSIILEIFLSEAICHPFALMVEFKTKNVKHFDTHSLLVLRVVIIFFL